MIIFRTIHSNIDSVTLPVRGEERMEKSEDKNISKSSGTFTKFKRRTEAK
jgi:hypothetical protein